MAEAACMQHYQFLLSISNVLKLNTPGTRVGPVYRYRTLVVKREEKKLKISFVKNIIQKNYFFNIFLLVMSKYEGPQKISFLGIP